MIDTGHSLIEPVHMGLKAQEKVKKECIFFKCMASPMNLTMEQIPEKFCLALATAAKTSYKATWCAYTYNSQVDQKAKMKLQGKINPSEHLSDSCISRNLTDNPSKCCSQLTPIGGTLPAATNSHLPHPQRECVCVWAIYCLMPPPLHSPWSRWVSWIFKDIPTLLSIWAPSVQPLMFNADRHTGLEASKALCGLWTRSGQYCLQKGTVEQDSCISVPLHFIEKIVHVYPQGQIRMFPGQSPVVL